MKTVSLGLALTFPLCISAAAQGLLSESWDGVASLPSDDWSVFSEDGVHYPYIDELAGSPAPSLGIGGGTAYEECFVYHSGFQAEYASAGLTIDTGAWLSGTGAHFTDLHFGLLRSHEGYPQPLAEIWLNKGSGPENNVIVGLYSDDPDHAESLWISGPLFPSAEWFTATLVVRLDQRVEAYIDGSLLWTSTKTIDPAFNGMADFYYRGREGGGPARFDNLVITPEPGALVLLSLAGLLVLRRR